MSAGESISNSSEIRQRFVHAPFGNDMQKRTVIELTDGRALDECPSAPVASAQCSDSANHTHQVTQESLGAGALPRRHRHARSHACQRGELTDGDPQTSCYQL